MTKNELDVLGLGQSCLDTVMRVDAYPASNAKCELEELAVVGGGPVATALVALARWGVSCAMAGIVGDDRFGPQIQSSLEEEGVDTTGLLVRPGTASQVAFIVAEPGLGHRTVFWKRPSGTPLRPEEVDQELLGKTRVFYTDGLFAEAALATARRARELGTPIVVDGGSLREGMLELAAESTCFLASETFARTLVGAEDPQGACRKLAELGPRTVGVTLGERGYVALEEGRMIERPAHPVTPIDTTGCGDIFHAGYTLGLLRGWTAERSLDFGSWAASRTSLGLGGRRGIPSLSSYPGPGSAPGGAPPDPSGRAGSTA